MSGTSAIHGVLLLVSLAMPALGADGVPVDVAGLRFVVPKDWERVPPTSPVRAAQFRLPRASRQQHDGELLLIRIEAPGVDLVGSWYAEFGQGDAHPAPRRRTVHGLTVETVDVQGTYRTRGMQRVPVVPTRALDLGCCPGPPLRRQFWWEGSCAT